MSNYDRQLELGQRLFLDWDQERMIARHSLVHDESYLYISFLGMPHRIRRTTAEVENMRTGLPAGFNASLSIYDLLARENLLPGMSGRRCAVNSLKHITQSSPGAVDFHRREADFLQQHIPALKQLIAQAGWTPFPQGDAACVIPVFDCLDVVFQFWAGDEEFPPSVRFLWDENVQAYQRFETLFFVMGEILALLRARIGEIEKNV